MVAAITNEMLVSSLRAAERDEDESNIKLFVENMSQMILVLENFLFSRVQSLSTLSVSAILPTPAKAVPRLPEDTNRTISPEKEKAKETVAPLVSVVESADIAAPGSQSSTINDLEDDDELAGAILPAHAQRQTPVSSPSTAARALSAPPSHLSPGAADSNSSPNAAGPILEPADIRSPAARAQSPNVAASLSSVQRQLSIVSTLC